MIWRELRTPFSGLKSNASKEPADAGWQDELAKILDSVNNMEL
jgi:hypothetical protein